MGARAPTAPTLTKSLITILSKMCYFQGWQLEYCKYDIMRDYFLTIPLEEQDVIWSEVGPNLEKREKVMKRMAARKALAKSDKK